MIKDYFELAFKNLRRRKLRSWLTIIGIFVSIAIVFVLISLSVGLKGAIQQEFQKLGSDKFFIQPSALLMGGPGAAQGTANFTTDDANVVEKVSGIRRISYLALGNGKIEHSKDVRYFQVAGIPTNMVDIYTDTGSYVPVEGSFLKNGDLGKAVLGNAFKTGKLFPDPLKAGDKILINGKIFKVQGILESFGNPSDDRLIFIPFNDFKELFNSGDRIDQITVQVLDQSALNDVSDKVEKELLKHRNLKEKNKDFRIVTPVELLNSFGLILNIITAFLVGVSGISLVVGAIGIANTMYTSVLERTREIGTMKAVGAQNKDILLIFLIESGLLGLVGGIGGVLIGFGIGKAVEYIVGRQFGFGLLKAAAPAWLIIGCLAFAFLIGAVSGTWPAYRASKIRPVDALRYE